MPRRRRALQSPSVCRLPPDLVSEPCGVVGKLKLCVGDRVTRPLPKPRKAKHGVVLAVVDAKDNRGREELAARVCFDSDEPGDLAYPYLFSELKKG